MTRKKITWLMWGFWVTLSFSPMIITAIMFALGFGFKIGVWAGTLLLAVFGFFKAQQSVVKMRSLAADDEIERWYQGIRRGRVARRLRAAQNPAEQAPQEPASEMTWELAPGWSKFRRHAFWWEIKKFNLNQHVGDLFHLLGLKVKRVGMSIFVNGDTLISIVPDGARSAPEAAEELSNHVAEKMACRVGILISPFGFKLSTYRDYEDSSLILLDASNLATLSRKYIG